MASPTSDETPPIGVLPQLRSAAIRRGVLAIPAGIAIGWLLGRAQSDGNADQEATVLALYLGFALVPAFASSLHVGRVAGGRLRVPLLPSIATAVVTGAAWGALGGAVLFAFGLATALDLNGPGAVTLCLSTGLVAGALGAFLGVALGRRQRR